jgi:hypothetical protein
MVVRSDRELGDKLGPKLVSLITRSIIATNEGLLDTHHVRGVRVGKTLIDEMGEEAARQYRGIMDMVLAQENMHPELRDMLEKSASGHDQWQAAGQFIFSNGGVASALGGAISNAVAPIVYAINRIGPNLDIDPSSAAQAVAARIVSFGDGASSARDQGIGSGPFNVLVDLSKNRPDPSMLFMMFNRGLITAQQFNHWMQRLGYDDSLTGPISALSGNIITVADAALAVLKGNLTAGEAQHIAKQNGFNAADFTTLVNNTREPPGLMQLLEAYRRKFINRAQLEKGIRESRVSNEWIPTIESLRYEPMSPADAIQAHVQNYISLETAKVITEDGGLLPAHFQASLDIAGEPLSREEMTELWRRGHATQAQVEQALRESRLKDKYLPFALNLKYRRMGTADAIEATVQNHLTDAEARKITEQNGLLPADYEALRLTAGEPLPKMEMLTLYRRKQVTRAQVEQALRESRLKDKYIPHVFDLATTLPPLFEVRAMLIAGVLTPAIATRVLLEEGYQLDIVKAIIASASHKAHVKAKSLTEPMYAELYQEHAITGAEFIVELKALGYSHAESELLKTIYDHKIDIAERNEVIAAIRAAYVGHHISETQAQNELNELHLPSGMVEHLMNTWALIIRVQIRRLTPAQVADAWHINLFDSANVGHNLELALEYLASLDYGTEDAIRILELKNKGPLAG